MAISVRNPAVCQIKTAIHGFAHTARRVAWNIAGMNPYNVIFSLKFSSEVRHGSN